MRNLTRYPNMKPYDLVDVHSSSYVSIDISFCGTEECQLLNRLNRLCNDFGFSRSDVIKSVLISVLSPESSFY